MVAQRTSPSFFGAGLDRPRGNVSGRWTGRRPSVRLPAAARRDLAIIDGAARRAGDGDLKSALSAVERTLLHRATMGPTAADHARMEALGFDAWLDEQLDYESIDDSALEDALKTSLKTISLSARQLYNRYDDNPFVPMFELWTAAVFRAVYSPRQLYERMVVFWTDHFNIDLFADWQHMLKPVDDREVLRRHALGTFGELVSASAHSPAMLVYLTNDTNGKDWPNENYARELLELHTMGADNGYDEKDVKELARCLTGWTWNNPWERDASIGEFWFDASIHDTGSKVVLNNRVPAGGGVDEGERIIDLLVGRRETAELIATKLLRYFWGYEPRKAIVNKVRRAYKRSGGDIRDTLRVVLSAKHMRTATTKLKRPFHMMVSALRATGAEMEDAVYTLDELGEAGHQPFAWTPPNGYPDDAAYWSGFLMPRWNFAGQLLADWTGVTVPSAVDDPSGTAAEIVERIDQLMLAGRMRGSTRAAVEAFLETGQINRDRVGSAIGQVAASPEFQEY